MTETQKEAYKMGNHRLYVYVRRVSDDEIVLRVPWTLRMGPPDKGKLLDRAVFEDKTVPRNYRGKHADGRNRAEYYVDDFNYLEALEDCIVLPAGRIAGCPPFMRAEP